MLIAGLVLLAVALVALGYVLSNAIVRPPRAPVGDIHPVITLASGEIIVPRPVEFENRRGLTIRGHYWARPERGPAIVYGHGNASNRLSVLDTADELLEQGFQVLAIDFAGCGDSDGDLITLGYHEWQDLSCALDWIEMRPEVDAQRLALFGRSMGASASLLCATRDERVRSLVLDSPFADLGQLCREQGRKMGLPEFPSWSVVRQVVRWRAGFDPAEVVPIEGLERLDVPILLIHGESDELIGIHHSERVLAARPELTELWRLPGARHNDWRGDRYADRIATFLSETLRP
ncbi:MAG: alpha/beta fold hydrolase [Planctomycetota bacterium]